MSLATRLAQKALDKARKYGAELQLVRRTPGAYNPGTGTASETTTSYTVYGIVEEAGRANGDRQGTAGTTTQAAKLSLAALGMVVAPQPGDVITGFQGLVWKVTGATPVMMGTTVLMWIVKVQA